MIWGDQVNESSSFLETSSTAMTHWAITTAVQQQFLTPRSKWDACIKALWKVIVSKQQRDFVEEWCDACIETSTKV